MRAPRATCLASRKWTGETRERVDPTASHAARFAWSRIDSVRSGVELSTSVSTDRTTRPCAFGAFLLHMIHCTPSSRRQMTSLYP